MNKNLNFIFFGGEPLSVPTLQKLYDNSFIPSLIVSNPDKPQGRNMEITPPPTAIWAKEHNISVFQPESLRDKKVIERLEEKSPEFFVVVSYSKIIPKNILDISKLGAINIHPSILPRYRGPSPIVAPILNGDKETGVTIIKIDEEMDHGPILAQEKFPLSGNEFIQDLEKFLAELGGELLVKILPDFVEGKIKATPQVELEATYCKKIKKEDGLIDLADDPVKNYNKFRAYATWPRTYFFSAQGGSASGGKDGKRIIITDATLENNQFIIKKVLPEGKREISWEEFKKTSISM